MVNADCFLVNIGVIYEGIGVIYEVNFVINAVILVIYAVILLINRIILVIYGINLIKDLVILQIIIDILLIYAVIVVINAIILLFNIATEVLIYDNPVKINKQGIKMSDSPQYSPSLPLLSCNALVRAIGCLKRWNMLKILSAGEAMGASELGKLVGCNVSTACKHMQILAAAGLVEQGRGRLYRIPARFQPTPGQPVLDYGHCLIRFDITPTT